MHFRRVLVVGGGISGLSTAYFLRTAIPKLFPVQVTVAEQSERLGGWIHSSNSKGFLFEQGPRSLLARKGSATVALIKELGLQDQIVEADSSAKKRYVWCQGRLQKLPQSFMEAVKAMIQPSILQPVPKDICYRLWKGIDACLDQDESVHAFFQRNLGEHAANQLIDPMVAGIYAGKAKELSIRSCFPDLWEIDQKHGNLLKGVYQNWRAGKQEPSIEEQDPLYIKLRHAPMYSFQKGTEQLTQKLAQRLEELGVDVRTKCSIKQIKFDGEKIQVRNSLHPFVSEDYDHIFFTTPAPHLAKIFRKSAVLSELQKELEKIRLASLYITNLGFESHVLPHTGFGCLFPSSASDIPILGVTYDSDTFPTQDRPNSTSTRLTVMMGGSRRPDLLEKSDSEIQNIALESLRNILGIQEDPFIMQTHMARECIAQYKLGHHEVIDKIKTLLNNSNLSKKIFLTGASYNGVSVNDCIRNAKKAAFQFHAGS